jgi:hypothetical protein
MNMPHRDAAVFRITGKTLKHKLKEISAAI